MLTIRQAQMNAFAGAAVDDFVERMTAHLAISRPEAYADLGVEEARAFIRRTLARAGRAGIDTEGGVAALVDLMVQVGEDFERAPDHAWAQKLLAHPTLPGALKIDALVTRIGGSTQGRIVERS